MKTELFRPSHELPLVTVILPVRNESLFIKRSLGSVLSQDYPSDRIEVLVADGMSTDETRQIIASLAATHPRINVSVIDNPQKIVATGLNLALAQANGEIIVRVDGHTTIAPDYVRQCVEALRQTQADNVGGRMRAEGNGWWGKAIAFGTSHPFGVGGARFHYSTKMEWVDTVYMGAWPRSVFQRIGVFDEEMVRNQDDEFNYRLSSQGGKILLSPQIQSQYSSRDSILALWRQYFQYGFWKVRVMQKHPRQMQPRQFAPVILVSLLSLLLGFSFFSVLARWILISMTILYVLADAAASLQICWTQERLLLPVLMLVFPTLHLSYGLGFLAGLARFWDRWRIIAQIRSGFPTGDC